MWLMPVALVVKVSLSRKTAPLMHPVLAAVVVVV
jgi:hypothetical protein